MLSRCLLLLAVGCGDSSPADPNPQAEVATEPQVQARHKDTAGEAIYKRYCLACHGADGRGNSGLSVDLIKDSGRLTKSDADLMTSVRDGTQGPNGVMPAWAGVLDEQQMTEAIHYMRDTFSPKPAPSAQ